MTNTLLLSDHRSGSFCCEPRGRNRIKPGELRGEDAAGSAPLREPQWIRRNRRAQPGHGRTGGAPAVTQVRGAWWPCPI